MPLEMTSLTQISSLDFDDIIDVRSPAEFAEDHIPGAINLPALSNRERAIVGTIYVQESAFKARRTGAALVARNVADHIEQSLTDRDGSWKPLVYCWRGGQRSGSFASILSQIGWRAELVEGGYKSYRRLVVQALYKQSLSQRFILIDGNTGTAKTDILHALAKAGAQVVDLEAMAAHRGSLFGAVPGGQPSQKAFEGRVAVALAALDTSQPVFVEAESNKIGDLLIPPTLWHAMIAAPRITISASLDARADFLMRSYADLVEDQEELLTRIGKLSPYHARDVTEHWRALAIGRNYRALARELMAQHYDPRYAKTYAKRDHEDLGQVCLPSLDPDNLALVAVPQILKLAGL